MGKSSDAPAPPDYAGLIPLQAQANTRQFLSGLNASRINSITPYGTTTWYGPGQNVSGAGSYVPPSRPVKTTPTTAGAGDWVRTQEIDPSSGPTTENPAPPPAGVPPAASWDEMMKRLPQPSEFGPWTAVTALSPEQQRLYEQSVSQAETRGNIASGLLGNAAQIYSTPADFASGLQTDSPSYDQTARQRSEEAIYGRAARYFDPQVERDRQALQDRLVQQGLNIDSDAYRRAMQDFEDTTARSRADMREAAIVGGGQEATAELARALQAQGQRFQQALSKSGVQAADRARTMQELNSLLSGGGQSAMQSPGAPLALGQGQPSGLDITGAANTSFQNQLSRSNAQAAQEQSFWNGLMNAIMMYGMYASGASCDRRLKTDVMDEGGGMYSFRYLGDEKRYFGRMAQDAPAGVTFEHHGFLHVPWYWVLTGEA